SRPGCNVVLHASAKTATKTSTTRAGLVCRAGFASRGRAVARGPDASCSRPVPTRAMVSGRSLALYEPMDVVVEDEHHQREDEEEADLLRDLAMARLHGTANERLHREERQMAAVEDRDRQEVQDGEIDREERERREEVAQPGARLLPGG